MSTLRADKVMSTTDGIPNVKGHVIYVDTIADLQALDTNALADGQQVQVKEYHAGTGVGGGVFYWDISSTVADDGGTIFQVSGVATGRWIRKLNGKVSPDMWGGVDTVAFQKCADYAANNPVSIFLPSPLYTLTDTVYIGVDSANNVIKTFMQMEGVGKGSTTISVEVFDKPGIVCSNLSWGRLTIKGRGKNTGNLDKGVSYYTSGTVRDVRIYDAGVADFDSQGIRLSSAYNGIFENLRVERCYEGIVFDGTGPWGLGTTTWDIQAAYVAACEIGIRTVGSSRLSLNVVTAEYNGIGVDLGTGGALIARRLYLEGNRIAGVRGINVTTYVDISGTKTTATDADDVTYLSTNPHLRGRITEFGGPSNDINTRNGNTLGVNYEDNGTVLFHKWRAVGSESGLRDKYPLVGMNPYVELSGYVYSDGSQYSKDQYGLVVSRVSTGVYQITWNATTFNNQSARVPIVSITPNEGGESEATNPFLASYYHGVLASGDFNVSGKATGIRVVTRQWNGTDFAKADCAFSFDIKIRLGQNANEIPNFNLFGRNTT